MSDDTHTDKPDHTAIIDLMIDTLVTIYEMEDKLGALREQLEDLSNRLFSKHRF